MYTNSTPNERLKTIFDHNANIQPNAVGNKKRIR